MVLKNIPLKSPKLIGLKYRQSSVNIAQSPTHKYKCSQVRAKIISLSIQRQCSINKAAREDAALGTKQKLRSEASLIYRSLPLMGTYVLAAFYFLIPSWEPSSLRLISAAVS